MASSRERPIGQVDVVAGVLKSPWPANQMTPDTNRIALGLAIRWANRSRPKQESPGS